MRILLSRTDSIGDVVLTLPMAGYIKKYLPDARIHFLGKSYTKDVIQCSSHVDKFINWDDLSSLPEAETIEALQAAHYDAIIHVFPNKKVARLAKKAGIKKRIGTSGRLYHYVYCNTLVRFTRKRSNLHEAQLNLKLLKGIGLPTTASLDELLGFAGFNNLPELSENVLTLLNKGKINIILHPKSKGSAVEWGLENFKTLMEMLPEDAFQIFVSGTKEDAHAIGDKLPLDKSNVTSLLGKLNLREFISFIANADALVAASTGPLHIAAVSGKVAIGLYSGRRPIHPGRWAPIGIGSKALVNDPACPKCLKGELCNCILNITPERVMAELMASFQDRF